LDQDPHEARAATDRLTIPGPPQGSAAGSNGWRAGGLDCPPMIKCGQADEAAIAKVRRDVRDARWTFIERCAKTLVPVLSLLVALAALLTR
jgi:hypothetical protein